MKTGDMSTIGFVLGVTAVGIIVAIAGCVRSESALWGAGQPPQDFSQTTLKSDPQIQRMNEVATKVVAGLKQVSAEFDLDFRGSDIFRAESGKTTYPPDDTPKVELETKDYRFTFEQANGHLAAYILWSHASTAQQPLDKRAPWTEDELLKVASAIRHVLVDESKYSFAKPKTKYSPDAGTGENYREGQWWVYWSRVDAKGHPFGGNGVQLRLSQTVGVISATTYLDDLYVEQEGQPMVLDQAVAIAKKIHPAMGTNGNTITDYSLKSSDLELIRPYGAKAKPCRLTWIIWLQPIKSDSRPGPTFDDSQEVSVDAINGKIVGQNCML